jgi:hypothetical protein
MYCEPQLTLTQEERKKRRRMAVLAALGDDDDEDELLDAATSTTTAATSSADKAEWAASLAEAAAMRRAAEKQAAAAATAAATAAAAERVAAVDARAEAKQAAATAAAAAETQAAAAAAAASAVSEQALAVAAAKSSGKKGFGFTLAATKGKQSAASGGLFAGLDDEQDSTVTRRPVVPIDYSESSDEAEMKRREQQEQLQQMAAGELTASKKDRDKVLVDMIPKVSLHDSSSYIAFVYGMHVLSRLLTAAVALSAMRRPSERLFAHVTRVYAFVLCVRSFCVTVWHAAVLYQAMLCANASSFCIILRCCVKLLLVQSLTLCGMLCML